MKIKNITEIEYLDNQSSIKLRPITTFEKDPSSITDFDPSKIYSYVNETLEEWSVDVDCDKTLRNIPKHIGTVKIPFDFDRPWNRRHWCCGSH